MERARRHQRLLAALAFGLLCVAAELVGAGLTHRIDLGRHVRSPGYSHAAYYPALIIAVKAGIALLSAALVRRMLRAHAIHRAARRVVGAVGGDLPRLRVVVSVRLALAFFLVTTTVYLVHADADGAHGGRWALFFPWVHSSALPVFAVLAVLLALLWSVVQRWLNDFELYAENAARLARRLSCAPAAAAVFPRSVLAVPLRRLLGLVFDSRPPPLAA